MQFIHLNDKVDARQIHRPPSVYFDHWAVCEFSENSSLQNRLVKALHGKQGTFVFSINNIAEFSSPTDQRHAKAAESFLNHLLPNVYLTDLDISAIVNFYNYSDNLQQRIMPPPYKERFELLAKRSYENGEKWSFDNFLNMAPDKKDNLLRSFNESNRNILECIQKQRELPDYYKKALHSTISTERNWACVVVGELMRHMILDKEGNISLNDISDFQHAAIPLICCDFLLLDNKWNNIVQEVSKKVMKSKLKVHLAHSYSKHNDGIEHFLVALESFNGQ